MTNMGRVNLYRDIEAERDRLVIRFGGFVDCMVLKPESGENAKIKKCFILTDENDNEPVCKIEFYKE